MLLSRLRPQKKKKELERQKKKIPELDEFLEKRDYAGAISLLEFRQTHDNRDLPTDLWLGHCYFQAGDYKSSAEIYEIMLEHENCPREVNVFLGICLFYMGMYKEAKDAAEKGEKSHLQNRLLFHVYHKLNDEKKLLHHHAQLKDTMEDQLSLASIHYLRLHYNQATDIYKKLLMSHKNFIAVNVYLAMCYYKLDYYDVSLEVLQVYLKQFPDSPAALNLKACNLFRLYTGKAALQGALAEIEPLFKQSIYPFARDLLRHNVVVFKQGDGALQVFPSLIDVLPEARLNLIIYYLKRDDIDNALSLVNDMEPQIPQEFLLKAIVFVHIGHMKSSSDHLKTAEQFFKMVGESAAECDTIAGRQAMASCLFLQKQYDEVLVYLDSIKSFFENDDTFNFNYGQCLVMAKQWAKAESHLLLVQGEDKNRPVYKLFLARAYVHNKKPQLAWDLYTRTKNPNESFTLLRLIAHRAYYCGEFVYACLAFDALEKIDPSPEHWEGKRGAAAGVFMMLCKGFATREQMSEVLHLLEKGNHPQVDHIVSTIRKWGRRVGVQLK